MVSYALITIPKPDIQSEFRPANIRPLVAPLYLATWNRVYTGGRMPTGNNIDPPAAVPEMYTPTCASLATVTVAVMLSGGMWFPSPDKSIHILGDDWNDRPL